MEYSTFMAELQIAPEKKEIKAESLYEYVRRIKDKRERLGKRYQVGVVLTLFILAKLAGETKLRGIVEWVQLRQQWMAERLPLRNGKVPCENTYHYVCEHSEVEELNEVLGDYFAAATGETPDEQAKPVQ